MCLIQVSVLISGIIKKEKKDKEAAGQTEIVAYTLQNEVNTEDLNTI